MTMTPQDLAELVLEQTRAVIRHRFGDDQAGDEKTEVITGPVYTKVDRGPAHNMSGFLMIENATGAIYGIKGYGRVHKGHRYGTLDTAEAWFWGEYRPRPRTAGELAAASSEDTTEQETTA